MAVDKNPNNPQLREQKAELLLTELGGQLIIMN